MLRFGAEMNPEGTIHCVDQRSHKSKCAAVKPSSLQERKNRPVMFNHEREERHNDGLLIRIGLELLRHGLENEIVHRLSNGDLVQNLFVDLNFVRWHMKLAFFKPLRLRSKRSVISFGRTLWATTGGRGQGRKAINRNVWLPVVDGPILLITGSAMPPHSK